MAEDPPGREYLQFPLRAFFIVMVVIGLLAAGARWFLALENPGRQGIALGLGWILGFALVWMAQNGQLGKLPATLFMISGGLLGLWISGEFAFACGFPLGVIFANHGISFLNLFFRLCGVTVRRP